MDNNGIPEPEWYLELKSKTPPGEQPTYEKLTLAEFCGRFDLPESKALWEIRRCKLWGCGKPLLILRGKHPQSEALYTIPGAEADRYAEIIAAETASTSKTATPPATQKDKRPEISGQRYDALGKVMIEIIANFRGDHNRTPQYQEVVNKLKALAKTGKHPVVQEVADKKVYWKNRNGKEKTTSIHQIQNRLTRLNTV